VAELDQPRAYLGRVVENLANDDAKFAVRRSESFHEDLDHYEIAGVDPHAALEARDMLRRIEAAIPLLPDRTREIFMAHRFEDLTYVEIARHMGVSVKTVEKHISLALRALHRTLETRS
jgi:RNA polymerase sigma-70 factor (ECF subfamily)